MKTPNVIRDEFVVFPFIIHLGGSVLVYSPYESIIK